MHIRLVLPAAAFVVGLAIGASVSAVAATRSDGDPAGEPLVSGIGGVFLRARDPAALQAWYQQHLGIEPGPQGVHFLWRPVDEPDRIDRTVWSLFPHDTDYFGAPDQQVMVNYIVRDLDAVLSRLAQAGVHPVKDPEAYPYGRFAWVLDGEGNRIELWEPPATVDR